MNRSGPRVASHVQNGRYSGRETLGSAVAVELEQTARRRYPGAYRHSETVQDDENYHDVGQARGAELGVTGENEEGGPTRRPGLRVEAKTDGLRVGADDEVAGAGHDRKRQGTGNGGLR